MDKLVAKRGSYTQRSPYPGLCERCDNEPAEYKMQWVLLREPIYVCRFCKQELQQQFELEENANE